MVIANCPSIPMHPKPAVVAPSTAPSFPLVKYP